MWVVSRAPARSQAGREAGSDDKGCTQGAGACWLLIRRKQSLLQICGLKLRVVLFQLLGTTSDRTNSLLIWT